MGRDFVFRTDTGSPKSSLIVSRTNSSPASTPEMTLGEIFRANLYFVKVDGSGALVTDTDICNALNSVVLGIGQPGAIPTGGTYKLTFGANTTSAIAFNASANDIRTALGLLASIGGSANVQVIGEFPYFEITFVGALADAPQSLIVSDATLLTPKSNVDVEELQVGGGGLNEIQSIELLQQPYFYNAGFAPITESAVVVGFTGLVVLNQDTLLEIMSDGVADLNTVMEIQVAIPATSIATVASPGITIYNRVINQGMAARNPFGSSQLGAFNLGNGVSGGTITGLALPVVPKAVYPLGIRKPVGGLNLTVNIVSGTLTTDGFTFTLDGLTDATTYIFDYILIF